MFGAWSSLKNKYENENMKVKTTSKSIAVSKVNTDQKNGSNTESVYIGNFDESTCNLGCKWIQLSKNIC